jgi:NAD(P)-dependent dehydrogenase (short-subunit alcohol dehydrogenase family)
MTRTANAAGLERFSLSGRIVLVTGSTRGLGLAIAGGMAAAGAVVGINGRDAERVREIAKSIPDAFAAPFDITDLDAATAVIDEIVARHGRLDCLVNNAAVRDRRALDDITPEDFRRLIETNLVSQYALSRVAVRHMAARGGGRLVFISSMVGPQSFQGDPAYVASKCGLEALMRALASSAARASPPTRSPPDSSRPTAMRRSSRSRASPSWRAGFRSGVSDGPTSSSAPPSSWPPTPRPTSPARS